MFSAPPGDPSRKQKRPLETEAYRTKGEGVPLQFVEDWGTLRARSFVPT